MLLICVFFQYVAQSQPETDSGSPHYWMQGPVQHGSRFYSRHGNMFVPAGEMPGPSYTYHATGQTGRGSTTQAETTSYQGQQYMSAPRNGRVPMAYVEDHTYSGDRMT